MAISVDDKLKESEGGRSVEAKVGVKESDLSIDAKGEVVGDRTKEIRKQKLKLDTWG